MPYPRTFAVLIVLAVFGVLYSVSPRAAYTASYVVVQPVVVASSDAIVEDEKLLSEPVALATDDIELEEPEVMEQFVQESAASSTPVDFVPTQPDAAPVTETKKIAPAVAASAYTVPFYSQFTDISLPSWKKVGCGIASLAMVIDYYEPAVPVDTLLEEGIAAGAYLDSAGWTYAGLINVGERHGVTGESHDLGGASASAALAALESALTRGPVMVSVHYTFDPKNPIPHLVIANGIKDGVFYYNDPAEPTGGGSIPVTQFVSAWKKRYIEFWPV